MNWIRTGECNQCGQCCLKMKASHMLNEKGVCKYLSYDGEVYICLITTAKFSYVAVDEGSIPKQDYDYWFNECRPYPNPDDESHTPPAHTLPQMCSYRMVEVE